MIEAAMTVTMMVMMLMTMLKVVKNGLSLSGQDTMF